MDPIPFIHQHMSIENACTTVEASEQ